MLRFTGIEQCDCAMVVSQTSLPSCERWQKQLHDNSNSAPRNPAQLRHERQPSFKPAGFCKEFSYRDTLLVDGNLTQVLASCTLAHGAWEHRRNRCPCASFLKLVSDCLRSIPKLLPALENPNILCRFPAWRSLGELRLRHPQSRDRIPMAQERMVPCFTSRRGLLSCRSRPLRR